MGRWCVVVVGLAVVLGCGKKDPGGPPSGGGPPSTTFDIVPRYVGNPLPSHVSAVEDAVALWKRVITGDIPDVTVTAASSNCGTGMPGRDETIDDVVMWMRITTIDGPGGVLGRGGPCVLRGGSGLPAIGVMELDSADMSNSFMRRVIIHEMGHALGFGTIWSNRSLLLGAGGSDPVFSGTQATARFNSVGGTNYSGAKVPVENTGDPGTRDSHWRESVFGTELMTGFINTANDMLSVVSAGAMADLGYTVDFNAAEPYPLPIAAGAVRGQQAQPAMVLGDDILRLPIHVLDEQPRPF